MLLLKSVQLFLTYLNIEQSFASCIAMQDTEYRAHRLEQILVLSAHTSIEVEKCSSNAHRP